MCVWALSGARGQENLGCPGGPVDVVSPGVQRGSGGPGGEIRCGSFKSQRLN